MSDYERVADALEALAHGDGPANPLGDGAAAIRALRAEVETLKASVLALHAKRNEDIEHYRSQLSARDAEVERLHVMRIDLRGDVALWQTVCGQLLEASANVIANRDAEVRALQVKIGDAIHYLEKARIWGGMGWTWNHLRKELAEEAHKSLTGEPGQGGEG